MFCRNCGAKLKEDSKFCEFCGTKVDVKEDSNQMFDNDKTFDVDFNNVETINQSPTNTKENGPKKVWVVFGNVGFGLSIGLLALAFIPVFQIYSTILSVIPLVLSILAVSNKVKNAKPILGIIFSGLAMFLSVKLFFEFLYGIDYPNLPGFEM